MKNRKIVLILLIINIPLFFLILRVCINNIVINLYNQEKYSILSKSLYLFNINESYIAYYNNGNIYYKQDKFDEAIEQYKIALKKNTSYFRKCDIRINLSLAKLAKIDTTITEEALEQLRDAREVLYGDECAYEYGNDGRSESAEYLDDEIQSLEQDVIENTMSNGNNESEKIHKKKTIEEKLNEKQKKSSEKRNEELNNSSKYDYNEPYYDGIRW